MKKANSSPKLRVVRKIILQTLGTALLLMAIVLAISAMIVRQVNRIPRIYISLNGVSIDEIGEHEKSVAYGGNEILLEDENRSMKYYDVQIKGRGNATWEFDKKPYRLEFKNRTEVFGLGKIKKWNLLANYIDDSEMRNDLALKLAEVIGMEYASRGKFANLYVDGELLGLYYITTPIKIDKEVVDLKDEEAILVELDDAYCDTEEQKFITSDNNCLVLKDVRNKDKQLAELDKFGEDFEKFEKAVKKGDFETIQSLVDVDSFAKYFLLNEFAGNPDGFFTSFFMYKNNDDDLIHAGPVWDFDAAFGNKTWWGDNVSEEEYSPEKLLIRRDVAFSGEDEEEKNAERKISKLMFKLIDIPEFQEIVRELYYEKLDCNKEFLLGYIQNTANYIRESAIVDNEMWQKNDFEKSVDYLTWWVEQRFVVFERVLGEKIQLPRYIEEI